MKKYGNYGMFAVASGLVALVMVVTVVWASYSETLRINGSATVQKGAWDIHFENLQYVTDGSTINPHIDYAEVVTQPTIQGSTTIGDFSVSLKQPGDYVDWKFDIVNDGTFAALINGITYKTPVCTKGENGTDADATNVCKNIDFYLYYVDDNSNIVPIRTLSDYTDMDPYLWNDGGKKQLFMRVEYDENTPVSELPTDDVTVSNLGVTLIYVQEGMEDWS